MWKRNIQSWLIGRCFGFPFHIFLAGSDSQKFRVSAHRQINTVTQVCILLFSNIERGNGGAGTYSEGITVMSLSLPFSNTICPLL